jgi:metal-responsive CopG/Arc/MetJ family transcriptional regulator
MERVMCYFPKELLEDMNHFSEKEMISRNAFIITCILKHVKELKKEEKSEK